MNKNYYAIIMAGGIGSRFWPVSTKAFPKQFHDMLGTGQTLIQKTFSRLNESIPSKNIFVLTNQQYHDLVLEQLPELESEQLVLEPAMRNTAPCILYAALKIKTKNPNAVMVVAPSDHWIEDQQSFSNQLKTAFESCSNTKKMITFGIRPSFANTGYGYIQYKNDQKRTLKEVLRFTEKPDYATAKSFLSEGNYLWNSGIFIWSVSTIVEAFQAFQPKLFSLFNAGLSSYNTAAEASFINDNYPKAENISVDYAIMEHAKEIYVLPAAFDWNDLGTWGSLYDKLPKDKNKNAVVGAKVLANKSEENIISTAKEKLVVIQGLSGYIVVDTDNILLISPKAEEQNIKSLLKQVKDKFGEQF